MAAHPYFWLRVRNCRARNLRASSLTFSVSALRRVGLDLAFQRCLCLSPPVFWLSDSYLRSFRALPLLLLLFFPSVLTTSLSRQRLGDRNLRAELETPPYDLRPAVQTLSPTASDSTISVEKPANYKENLMEDSQLEDDHSQTSAGALTTATQGDTDGDPFRANDDFANESNDNDDNDELPPPKVVKKGSKPGKSEEPRKQAQKKRNVPLYPKRTANHFRTITSFKKAKEIYNERWDEKPKMVGKGKDVSYYAFYQEARLCRATTNIS